MSVLAVELGQADARLNYLPFEDISIRSSRDKKQPGYSLDNLRWLPNDVQLAHAPFTLQTGRGREFEVRLSLNQDRL